MVFCKNCGSELPSGSAYCTICGTRQEAVPTIPTPEARKRRFTTGRAAVVIVLIAVIVVFMVVRWVPVVDSYVSTEEFPYTYSYKVPQTDEKEMSREVLSESNIKLGTYYRGAEPFWKDFRGIRLEAGWSVVIEISGLPESCYAAIYQDWGSKNSVFSTSSSGHSTIMVPETGSYYMEVSNLGRVSQTVSSVKLTAHWIEITKTVTEITETATTTFQVARYNVTYISPFEWLLLQLYRK